MNPLAKFGFRHLRNIQEQSAIERLKAFLSQELQNFKGVPRYYDWVHEDGGATLSLSLGEGFPRFSISVNVDMSWIPVFDVLEFESRVISGVDALCFKSQQALEDWLSFELKQLKAA